MLYHRNRLLEVLSKMLNLAESWGFRSGTNPCRYVDRFRERPKNRFLSPEEIIRLQQALDNQARTTPHAAAALRLLLLTGCRRNEIISMKWEDIDLRQGVLKLGDSKTGERYVPLNDSAIEVLQQLQTTQRYAHLAFSDALAASNRVAELMPH